MNIGSVRHNDNGSISGYIRSLTLDVSIVLRPVTRTNDRSPSFDILARNVRDRFIAIGALWEKASKLHGEIYYRGQIDDPSLPEPLQIAAFPQEDGSMNIVFSRPNYSAANVGARGNEPNDTDVAGAPGYSGDEPRYEGDGAIAAAIVARGGKKKSNDDA